MRELFVDSITKSFDARPILNDIFISCAPGDIIGLLGRNGSGKSTLLKIIFGSINAENKYVRANGKILNGVTQSKGKISYLPQQTFLPAHLRVASIIKLLCTRDASNSLQEHPIVKPFLQSKPKQLSGGEKRMIEILVILNAGADYVLMDEPFNAIDPIFRGEVKQFIRQYAVNKGMIITDHDYTNVLDVATKIVLLHEGSTREIKSLEELSAGKYFPM
jgi:lipopolysaccharide export system ATP-binding protein